jgi:hypothetical protein
VPKNIFTYVITPISDPSAIYLFLSRFIHWYWKYCFNECDESSFKSIKILFDKTEFILWSALNHCVKYGERCMYSELFRTIRNLYHVLHTHACVRCIENLIYEQMSTKLKRLEELGDECIENNHKLYGNGQYCPMDCSFEMENYTISLYS